MSGSSKKAVIAAALGNAGICLTKGAAAAWTGSSAMLSEAIHSAVDVGNQVLLLHGLGRAARPADARHPFGYGKEIYFWCFVVAILIFALGGGLSFYEGVQAFNHPHPPEDLYINYLVLGAAFVFEAGSWWVAWQEFQKQKGNRGTWAAIRATKDPAIVTVLIEDTAALAGLLIALVGTAAGQITGDPRLDAITAMAIGALLFGAAVVMAVETKGLLIGEAAEPEVVHAIAAQVETDPRVLAVSEVMTLHMGPADIIVTMNIEFRDSLSLDEVESAIAELDQRIRTAVPGISRVFLEAASLSQIGRGSVPAPA